MFKKKSALFLFFIFTYLLIRLPVFPLKMQGEDGIFAALVTEYSQKADQTMFARVSGQEIFSTVAHPGLSYALLKGVGYLPPFFKNMRNFSPYWLTTSARFLFSLYTLAAFLLLLWFVTLHKKEKWKEAGIFLIAAAALPVTVAGSVYLQIDNTAGALVVGVFSFISLLITGQKISKKFTGTALFLAAAFVGFGKTEWSFVLIFAVCVGYVLSRLFSRPGYNWAAVILVGCLGGNFLNYIYSPQALLSGFDAMAMAKSSEGLGYFLKLTLKRLLWVAPLLFLQTTLLVFIWQKRKLIHFLHIVLLFFAVGLLAGYCVSFALPHSRYFIPALVATAALGAWCMLEVQGKTWKRVFVLFYVLAGIQITYYTGDRIKKTQIDKFVDVDKWEDLQISSQSCVPKADAIYFVSPYDFIFEPTSKEEAQRIASEHSQSMKSVCP